MCLVDSRGKCPFRVKLRNTQTEHRVISGHSVMSELCTSAEQRTIVLIAALIVATFIIFATRSYFKVK